MNLFNAFLDIFLSLFLSMLDVFRQEWLDPSKFSLAHNGLSLIARCWGYLIFLFLRDLVEVIVDEWQNISTSMDAGHLRNTKTIDLEDIQRK